MKQYNITAEIKEGYGGGAYIEIPFDVEKEFGKKRVKVKVLFEEVPYRGLLVRMNTECHILGIRKDIREKLKKNIGDLVNVRIEEDHEARVVEVPEDVLKALNKNQTINDKFGKLSYTHQKEYVNWINEAKKEETRKSRIEKMISMLSSGK